MNVARTSIIIIIFLVFSVGVYIVLQLSDRPDGDELAAISANLKIPDVLVTMDESGFAPEIVTIKAGQKVEWLNKGSGNYWPASNLHPTHSFYPGSGIFKCMTPDESTIFDSCRPIPPGETYSFMFMHKGEWRYHDHLKPNKRGIIGVE